MASASKTGAEIMSTKMYGETGWYKGDVVNGAQSECHTKGNVYRAGKRRGDGFFATLHNKPGARWFPNQTEAKAWVEREH